LRRYNVDGSEHYDGTGALSAVKRDQYKSFSCPTLAVVPDLYKLVPNADTTGITAEHHITFAYDSEYSFNMLLSKGVASTNGYLIAEGKHVFTRLFKLIDRANVHLVKVVGHSCCLLNDFADVLADQARACTTIQNGSVTKALLKSLLSQVQKKRSGGMISQHTHPEGSRLVVDLQFLFQGTEPDFSRMPTTIEPPNRSCADMVVTKNTSSWMYFHLVGFDALFRVDYGWVKKHIRVQQFRNRALLDAGAITSTPESASQFLSALQHSQYNATNCGRDDEDDDATFAQAGDPDNVRHPPHATSHTGRTTATFNGASVTSADGRYALPIPVFVNGVCTDPNWDVIYKFDWKLLGTSAPLKTVKVPTDYLRNRYASILDVVLTMATNLSRENRKESFEQQPFDAALKLTFLFSPLLLQSRGGGTNGIASFKKRQDSFMNMHWVDMVGDMVDALQAPPQRRSASKGGGRQKGADATADWNVLESQDDTVTQQQTKRAVEHINDGNFRKAKDCLVSPAEFAAGNADTFEKLKLKHPERKAENELDPAMIQHVKSSPDYTPVVVTEEHVWNAIKDSPRGSAPGVDGLRCDHFYYLGFNGSQSWLKPLTVLVNLAVQGDLPGWYFELIASANLVALAKGNSGDVRPIAMGSVWRKIISRSLLAYYKDEITEHFALYQYGVGTSAGCEVVLARVRQLLEQSPTAVLLKTDFSNAFNTIYRKSVLEAVVKFFPGMLPFVASVYIPKAELWAFIDSRKRAAIPSAEGVQQGDVFGSFLFCLTIHTMLLELNRILRANGNGEILGLADDTSLVCEQADVMTVWPTLQERSAALGLQLAPHKCAVYCPMGEQELNHALMPVGIQIATEGLVLLGAPLGTSDFCKGVWMAYLKEIERETLIVCGWSKVQAGLALFRLCITSKFNWMLRIVPPTAPYARDLTVYSRSILMNGLHLLLGDPVVEFPAVRPDSPCWLQATLPAKMGGIGIPDPTQTHGCIYMAAEASIAPSLTALSLEKGGEEFTPSVDASLCFDQYVSKDMFSSIGEMYDEPYKLQHKLVGALHVARRKKLAAQSIPLHHRLDSCSREGGALISASPKYQVFQIDDAACMRERLCMRLGQDIKYIVPGDCVCNSGGDKYCDAKGRHLLSVCKASNLGNDTNAVHNNVRNVLCEMGRAGGHTCRVEDMGILKADSEDPTRKRMDVVIDNFEGSCSLGIDVTVVDPRNQKYSKLCAPMAAGTCASDAEQEKIKKYADIYARQGHEFVPFAIESFGAFGPRTASVFNRLIAHIYAANVHMPLSFIKQYWRNRIEMALHVGASKGMKVRMSSLTKRRRGLSKAPPSPFESVDYHGWSRTNHGC
jgi:hypothetical protein